MINRNEQGPFPDVVPGQIQPELDQSQIDPVVIDGVLRDLPRQEQLDEERNHPKPRRDN